MAPKKKTKSKVSKRVKRPAVNAVGLDAQALAYAKLLADPCGAMLTHPIYSGGEGGYLVRCESFFSFATGATNTAGVLHWVPGAANATATELMINAAVDATTSVAIGTSAGIQTPGRAFLTDTVAQYRCVAACARVAYQGSESTRAGRIHYGPTTGGFLNTLESTSSDGAAQGLPHYSRTPPTEIEIKWTPTDADQLMVDPNGAEVPQDRGRRGAITIAVGGLPANVGLTVRLTAIYEWQPSVNKGLAVPMESRARSRNTLDQVLNFVQKAYSTTQRISGAVMDLSQTYGMMPAYDVRRALAYY